MTNFDNFSSMVTKRFSTYDEHFATLETSMEEINERLINQGIQLFVFIFVFDDAEGRKYDILWCTYYWYYVISTFSLQLL